MVLVMVEDEGVRVEGPLVGVAEGFAAYLRRRGFTAGSTRNQLWMVAHLSRWMSGRGVTLTELNGADLDAFLVERRAACSWLISRRALTHLLGFLADSEAVSATALLPSPTQDTELVGAFGEYLRVERRLAESTVREHLRWLRRFAESSLPQDLKDLRAREISQALLDAVEVHSRHGVRRYRQVLRTFLRFAFVTGRIDRDLTGATSVVRYQQPRPLAVGVTADHVQALLGSCDRTNAAGRRAYAVVLLLSRMGLRAGEVAAARVEDIDWHHGEVLIRGKGAKQERLPLPQQVGDAIGDYLMHARPQVGRREVFLQVRAPFEPLARENIANIVRQCCARAGVEEIGPHRLRRTLAEDMVRAGVPLDAIGQVLRHTTTTTTANYARVDIGQLRALARSWPSDEPNDGEVLVEARLDGAHDERVAEESAERDGLEPSGCRITRRGRSSASSSR